MNKTSALLLSAAVATMSGCSAIPAFPGASQITISHQPAGEDCEFLDEVMGSQGNLVTADFTSDRNLIEGARNDMRNNALNLGANYIVLETENHSHHIPSLNDVCNTLAICSYSWP